MVLLIAGGTHTGKTALAQQLLERYHYPYLSLDHLKMGLIRSGLCRLTPMSDTRTLTQTLWPVAREIIKTCIENGQNLLVEGCYIPFHYREDFADAYLRHIRYICLILSEQYIQNHFSEIQQYANVVEKRLDDSSLSKQAMCIENRANLAACKRYGCPYHLVEDVYDVPAWQVRENFLDESKTYPVG